MVVRFEHMWTALPALLVALAFVVVMIGIIKVWMAGAPVPRKPFPRYSLEVMRDLPPDKPPQPPGYYKPHKGPLPNQPARPAPPYPVKTSEAIPYPINYPGKGQSPYTSGAVTPSGYTLGARLPQQTRAWQGKFI